jgi:hypothetical protein
MQFCIQFEGLRFYAAPFIILYYYRLYSKVFTHIYKTIRERLQ